MSNQFILGRSVRAVLLTGGALAMSGFAVAQTAPASAPKSAGLEEVVITGSRIAAPNLESVSPVVSFTAAEIRDTGVTRVEDILNSLPSVVADQGSGLSMGSNGTATVNLRGLGPQRTLVLVNGRRLMGGDPNSGAYAGAADLNQIPVALVDRVEVLTGGASSTYGADAVACVVNFIMNDHFEGIRVDANVGISNHSNSQSWLRPLIEAQTPTQAYPSGTNWDGGNKDLTVVLGQNFMDGRGNITGYLGYRTASPITADHRDTSQCVLLNYNFDGHFVCYGSSNSAPSMIVGYNDGSYHQVAPDGTIGDRYARYNFSQTHYLQRQDERYTAGFFGKLKMNDHAEAYTEVMFMDDSTRGNYAPAGAFFGSGQQIDPVTGLSNGTLGVNCGTGGFGNAGMNPYLTQNEYNQICNFAPYNFSNPGQNYAANGTPGLAYNLLPNGIAQLTLARRNVEGGPRQDNYTHTSFRAVFGVRGNINDDWKYDTYGTASLVRMTDWHNNDTSTSRMQNALLAVRVNGQIVCQGGQAGCVPWNIFDPSQPISKEALAYISAPGLIQAYQEEDIVSSYVSGDLTNKGIKLPLAKQGLQVVLGAEYRRDHLTTHPDAEYQTGDLAGQGSPTPPVEGVSHVWEGFTELRLPIAEDVALAKSLDFEAGYRYSNYSAGFATNAYKFGLQWTPVSDLKLRGGYNRAVRVPNLQELYNPQHVALDGGTDPCASDTQTASLVQCAYGNPGLVGGNYAVPSPAGQYNGLIGGNTKLQPEVGTTVAFGLVFTPTFISNLSLTLDYSDIKITNLISGYGSNTVLNGCYNSNDPNNYFCSLIHRDPAGTIWASPQGYVVDSLLNVGGERNKSVDLGVAYRVPMGKAGDLHMRLEGTYLKSLLFTPAVGSSYDCAGFFGPSCQPALPKWRHTFMTDWETPVQGLSAGFAWRFFGSTKNSIVNPGIPGDYYGEGLIAADARIPTISYLDLHASYQWQKVTYRLGVNNALDKNPPLIDTQQSGGNSIYAESNTFPGMYNATGRYIYLNVTADF